MIVRHREGEAVGQTFAQPQALYREQGIVQAIGIVAVSVHSECAIKTRRIGLRDETHHIVQIRVRRSRQYSADRRRVLSNGGCGCGHHGSVVAAVDAHGHNSGRRSAVVVRHRNRKGIGQVFTQTQPLHRGQ